MVFEEWEMNVIIDSLRANEANIMADMVASKLVKLQKSSSNKRYTFRSTDWLSEANKKRHGLKRRKYMEGGLL